MGAGLLRGGHGQAVSTPTGITSDGLADVGCWCERMVKPVPLDLILRGETFSCGPLCYRGCKPYVHKPKKGYSW